MRINHLAALCAAVCAASNAAPAQKKAVQTKPAKAEIMYDFKGARLGMTLDEWRALPVPAKQSASSGIIRQTPPRPVCQTDAPESYLFFASKAEKSAGVIVCRYAYQSMVGQSSFWHGAYIPIGERSTDDVEYKFLDGRLFEINITAHTNLLSDVMDGLTAKWGEPDSVVNDTTQNKAGATFPHTERTWANPAASIRLESPYSRIDNLNVTYLTAAGAARINAVEKALNPDKDKM